MHRLLTAALVGGVMMAGASGARAQQRPLVTEDPETIGSGLVLLEGGFDQQREVSRCRG